MRFIFWQNMLAIHQSAFICKLSIDNKVTLIVEQDIEQRRKNDGWNIPNMGNAQIIIHPSIQQIDEIIGNNKDAIHCLSGIDSYFKYANLTQKLIDSKRNLICMLEPYNWLGLTGFIRGIKYFLLYRKYGKYFKAILATGKTGCQCYKKIGFSKLKIFEWGYFTEKDIGEKVQIRKTDTIKLLFVGRLDKNKNILSLLNECMYLKKKSLFNFQLSIIGNGDLKNKVIKKISRKDYIDYLGQMSNNEVQKQMINNDILILPSKYDGWGAVVNEALQNGMRVICSENCGASTLLSKKWRGGVFTFKGKYNLNFVLQEQLTLGCQTKEQRLRIISWAKETISGEVAANYFIEVCNHLYNGSERPSPPWQI